jgi:hypothetical protein
MGCGCTERVSWRREIRASYRGLCTNKPQPQRTADPRLDGFDDHAVDGETSRCGAGKKESTVKALQGPWPDLQVSSSARSRGPRRVQAWLR